MLNTSEAVNQQSDDLKLAHVLLFCNIGDDYIENVTQVHEMTIIYSVQFTDLSIYFRYQLR